MTTDDTAPTEVGVEQLHARYGGPLFVFALRMLGDREAAEEVVQDTLLRAWRNADRYDPERGSMDAWLFAIARNRAVDHHRRRVARPRTVAPLEDAPPEPTPADVDRVIEAWQLSEALERLSPEHRTAIVEVHYRGRTVRETAELLGVPEGTVKSRIYYGLRNLRSHLEERGVVA